jgi:LysM repeat protein
MVNRRRRSLGRWLAPLALITCVVAVYAVVDNTLLKDDSASNTGNDSTEKAQPTKTTSTGKATKTPKRRRAYIVKSGDTLSAISIKTGVSLATIQRLNPKIDADTLHAGQRVRLSR